MKGVIGKDFKIILNNMSSHVNSDQNLNYYKKSNNINVPSKISRGSRWSILALFRATKRGYLNSKMRWRVIR